MVKLIPYPNLVKSYKKNKVMVFTNESPPTLSLMEHAPKCTVAPDRSMVSSKRALRHQPRSSAKKKGHAGAITQARAQRPQ